MGPFDFDFVALERLQIVDLMSFQSFHQKNRTFGHLFGGKTQGYRLVPYTFSETSRQRWYRPPDLNIGVSPGALAA